MARMNSRTLNYAGNDEDIMPGPVGVSRPFVFFSAEGNSCSKRWRIFGKFNESSSLYVSAISGADRHALDGAFAGWNRTTLRLAEGPVWCVGRIAPSVIQEIMEGPDTQKSQRVMLALYQMKKIDVLEILRAAEGR
jgi:hypothetical protein